MSDGGKKSQDFETTVIVPEPPLPAPGPKPTEATVYAPTVAFHAIPAAVVTPAPAPPAGPAPHATLFATPAPHPDVPAFKRDATIVVQDVRDPASALPFLGVQPQPHAHGPARLDHLPFHEAPPPPEGHLPSARIPDAQPGDRSALFDTDELPPERPSEPAAEVARALASGTATWDDMEPAPSTLPFGRRRDPLSQTLDEDAPLPGPEHGPLPFVGSRPPITPPPRGIDPDLPFRHSTAQPIQRPSAPVVPPAHHASHLPRPATASTATTSTATTSTATTSTATTSTATTSTATASTATTSTARQASPPPNVTAPRVAAPSPRPAAPVTREAFGMETLTDVDFRALPQPLPFTGGEKAPARLTPRAEVAAGLPFQRPEQPAALGASFLAALGRVGYRSAG